jgi:hypothetical protein
MAARRNSSASSLPPSVNPVEEKLASAPIDDEIETPEEAEAVREARNELENGAKPLSGDELRRFLENRTDRN